MSAESALRELISNLVATVGAVAGAGEVPELWLEMVKLGLDVVGVPEASGGADGSIEDLAQLSEALGQNGIGVPLIQASTANWVLSEAGEQVNAGVLAAVAFTDSTLNIEGRLSARVGPVPWARSAENVIVYTASGSPICYRIGDPGVSVEPGVNLAGEQSDAVVFTAAAGQVLAHAPTAGAVLARLGVLWSAALLGAIRGAYELTRNYVRTREQFGAPLVKIPAVAAGLASIRTQLLQAEASVYRAVEIYSIGPSEHAALPAAAIARTVCATAATETARLTHQLHGAMGITAEYPLHRFTTKLWAWRDAASSESEWAKLIGDITLERGERALWDELTATA
ncbi:hypothetical protein GPX89_26510 [Nocardia sp. ET3-3]|uniref:Acyl-CoA dehydrogenase n=1 Tax=Nocardia terrae TaxID=2675851 RepID=A0A7K1V2C7_9NOCA|nr:acyl-CoA dehydrogenase family protein [Nocardia terrae]MVU80793.1 hypothetical protein [Nocardia terrae]